MALRHAGLAIVFLGLILACRSARHVPTEEELAITPEQWDDHLTRFPVAACEPSSPPDSGWAAWTLARPHATVRLPAGARELPDSNPDLHEWALPDSAHFEMWLTRDPASGLAAPAGMRMTLEEECVMPIAGHAALVVPYRAVSASGRDTAYGAVASTVLRKGRALNVFLDARSLERRQQLLGAAAELRVDPALH